MTTLRHFESQQERAREARYEARALRDLHGTATCGLPMEWNSYRYGTRQVPTHVAARIADQYLVWADEYDAIAEAIERSLERALTPVPDVPECPSCGDPIADGSGVYVRTDGSWRHEDCFPQPDDAGREGT